MIESFERAGRHIAIDGEEMFLAELRGLPWEHPIDQWRAFGVEHLDIRRGVGRHVVIFIRVPRHSFVIKELGEHTAHLEHNNYKEMLRRGIHTLIPIGTVVRDEDPIPVHTRIGLQYEPNRVGHSVTLLSDRVIPDSQLFQRAFQYENRKRIWDAIVDLFVELHSNGVYWGDASLANTLVKFERVEIPFVGKRIQLKAFLADAETVEIHSSISDSLRRADIEYFFESMQWLNEDLRSSGAIRDEYSVLRAQVYIRERYQRLYAAAREGKRFEKLSGLVIRTYLGRVHDAAYLTILQKHIEEHKWYLSERSKREIPFKQAARDWHNSVFTPMCELFRREHVLEFFPGKTAAELYVEIMTNKYYLSQAKKRDVGMIVAARDYINRFGKEPAVLPFWRRLRKEMVRILGAAAPARTPPAR